MSDHLDPDMSAIERMLRDRTRQAPPPALRTRVLAAVDDVLHDERLVGRGEQGSEFQWLAVGGLMATAVLLLFVLTLSRQVAVQSSGPATARLMLSFAQRAEAAGIPLDLETHSADRLAEVRPDDTSSPQHGHILHSIDARSFLQGDL